VHCEHEIKCRIRLPSSREIGMFANDKGSLQKYNLAIHSFSEIGGVASLVVLREMS
jgi:cytochrome oxidase assembly protein ShyY1